MKKVFFMLVALSALSACAPSVYTETDKVTGTHYVKCEMYLVKNDFREPDYSQKIIVVKETKPNQEPTYTWYDVMTLSVKNFDLDMNDMYLLVNKEVFPLENTYERMRNERNVKEKTQEVMKADSNTVSVVTGYDVVQKNVFQMVHPVSSDVMNRILDAGEVVLRYKVGPQFIHSEIRNKDLANIKTMIKK